MGTSTTLAVLILLGYSTKATGFMFSHGACGCPPPPPPPRCDCRCAQAAQPQYATQAAYAQQQPSAYYAPAAVQQQPQQQLQQSAYDAAIDNAALDSLTPVGQVSVSSGYQGPAGRGAYATGPGQPYPSTATINGFPSAQQSSYAQSNGVYGGQQTQSSYVQPASAGVYGGQQAQTGYAQSSQSVYGQQQQAYGQQGYAQASAGASPYTLSIPASQAQTQYVVADSAALNAFSNSIASQHPNQASYAHPSASVSSGLPASTIQYATVPAGVAVDQHLANQIASEAATYVSSNGNQYVQTKQNAFARQHNPSINEYAKVGSVEGGSAVREQYMTQPEPVSAPSTYFNANLHRQRPVHVRPVIVDLPLPTPPAPTKAQFSAPSDIEILAAEQSDPMILPVAAKHDAPPLPVSAPQTVIETVDTTSLVLPSNDIIATDAAEVSQSVHDLNTMSAPEFEQALQRAELVPEESATVAVKAPVNEQPKQHTRIHTVEGESEFQGAKLTEENLLEGGNVLDNEVEHKNIQPEEQPDPEESETLPDVHLTEGISIRTRVHAAPTATLPRKDFGLARH